MADNLFFLFSSLLISSSSVILLFVINSCVGGPGGATLGTVGSGGLGGVGWLPCAVARATWLRRAVARAAAAPTRGDSGGGNSDAWRLGRRRLHGAAKPPFPRWIRSKSAWITSCCMLHPAAPTLARLAGNHHAGRHRPFRFLTLRASAMLDSTQTSSRTKKIR
jgi:hypothetical protein